MILHAALAPAHTLLRDLFVNNALAMLVDDLRRSVILSLSSVAAVAISCLLYQAYIATGDATSQGLHRSNAVRRPRDRRAQLELQRASAEKNEEDSHTERPSGTARPIDIALMNLDAARQQSTVAFGTYRHDRLRSVYYVEASCVSVPLTELWIAPFARAVA